MPSLLPFRFGLRRTLVVFATLLGNAALVAQTATNFTAAPGDGYVALSWSPPAGLPVTGYTLTATNANTPSTYQRFVLNGPTLHPSATFRGLVNGAPYVFTVTVEASGLSSPVTATSAIPSAAVDPLAQALAQVSSLQAQVATLTTQNSQLQQQVATLQASLTNQQNTVDFLSAVIGTAVGNPSFVIPGATLTQQLQSLTKAIDNLNQGQQQALYRNLGGKAGTAEAR
jgi:chaperonin cofactor prefoldin